MSQHRPRRPILATITTAALVLGTASLAAAPGGASAAEPTRGKLPAPHRAELPAGQASPFVRSKDGIPTTGRHAFLLQLGTASTGRVFATKRASGAQAAKTAARAQLTKVKDAQDAVVDRLPAKSPVLYRTHAALSAVAVTTDAANYDALTRIPNVTAVYPITPKSFDNSYAVPLQGAPQAWEGNADLGSDITIGVIDTGIDYTHANFGGPGTTAAYDAEHATADSSTLTSTIFPNDKVVGGYDLVGDSYNADPSSATYQPVPTEDPNPLDCEGHGSHVAGSATGLGVTRDGDTYDGDYDANTDFDAFRIGPGMAPKAKLMSFRVFGCEGSTDVTSAAIDRALDPNNDGLTNDAVDVINMSLGSDFGSPFDGDAVMADQASSLGVTMAISSGNSYDLYDVGGSPGTSTRAITVAASLDAQSIVDGLNVSFDGEAQEPYAAERSVDYHWDTPPDLAGEVVDLGPDVTGCSAFTPEQAALIAGKIVILKWTDDNLECGSVGRSSNVANAGGIGFIFASNLEAFSAGITGSKVIPGVLVNKSGGDAIRAAIADGQTVTVTGTARNAVTQKFPEDDDRLTDFSSRGIHGAGHLKPDVTAVGGTVFSTSVGTGNEGETESGTSMAAPMVAGLAALVRSAHPAWNSEQVKADIMNTASQDIDTNGSDTEGGERYAPNRVGSGRIVADAAVANDVVAYAADAGGAVSVSFGPLEVTAPLTLTKKVTVQNTGSASRTYATSYDAITSVPGVAYSASPANVTVSPGQSADVTVTLSIADPSQLTKTVDATHGRGTGELPLETLADASGNLLLTPASGQELRVPVYSAPRPASVMSQPGAVALENGAGTLTLDGQDVDQGTGASRVTSLAAGFELQATSRKAPACSQTVTQLCIHNPDDKGADVKYVGVTSDAPVYDTPSNGLAYFGIATHGAHSTAAGKIEFDVLIDLDRDGVPDVVAYTTRVPDSDVFLTELVNMASGKVIDDEVTNNRFGDVDTALFDSDVLMMPVWLKPLRSVLNVSSRVNYAIATFTTSSPDPIDLVGFSPQGDVDGSLTTDLYNPGVAVFGEGVQDDAYGANTPYGPLVSDQDGSELDVVRDASSYAPDHGQGMLMFHFHNKVGDKAQVVALKQASTVSLEADPATIDRGESTELTVTVADPDDAGTPTGPVSVEDADTHKVVASGTLEDGAATISYTPSTGGTKHLVAVYDGDADYAGGESSPVTVTVNAVAGTVSLGASPATVQRGGTVKLTVGVAHASGDPVPTGSVSVVSSTGTIVAHGRLGSGGSVTLSAKPTEPGRLTLHATYAGDANYEAGSSTPVSVTVKKAAASVKLAVAGRSGKVGKRVSTTVSVATVGGIRATGRVVLKAGSRILGSAKLRHGRVTITFVPKAAGTLRLRATYAGDTMYTAGSSRTVTYTVKKAKRR